ncbi:hypothetical protein H2202_000915 [Exophiala xenobiotica]|nr:hypothetical protein H2202_000915 [Exophiala xenobiotica]KAK5209806.1 hypothetical protein LTR41_004438 [Exophiala xenobiotica]KAK5235971.1 hypothetical protein LTR47_002697 [Exophiala xenobiotica]KAK5253679.1 hypothetical protein LTS06_001808 [Exophiala xenobiotica]KAK5262487.1 hypothetical protein LTR40_000327 [Exophiala xenobiotica]
MLLTSLLLVLLNLVFTFAQQPDFYFPPGTSDPQRQQVYQAFRDAITLARVVATTGDPCDQAFRRYFQPQDYYFVQNIFKEIANIPITENPNPMDISRLVSRTEFNPNFTSLSISLGNHPLLVSMATFDKSTMCSSDVMTSSLANCFYQYWPGTQFSGLISLCPDSSLFLEWVSLQDTENPPAWARVNGDPTGQPLPGFGCDGLGDHDSNLMAAPGAIMLHELMHWPGLLRSVPDYENLIHRDVETDQPVIEDFSGSGYPPNGYGPFYARIINEGQPLDPRTGKSQSILIVDNYMWYALSKYWSFKCRRIFGPSLTQNDKFATYWRQKAPRVGQI